MKYVIACMAVFVFAQRGMGRIIVGPKDTEAVVGTQLVLRCQTDIKDSTDPVEWNFKANDYEAYGTIYKDGMILSGNKSKMKVYANATIGRYDLVIFNVSISNAGTYACLENSSQQRAEVIVFERYPSDEFCSLTKPSDVILGTNQCNMEPDQIEISCKLRYQGNLKPHLEWFNGERLISSNSSTSNGIITSTVLLRADTLHSPTFNCRVGYENNMASMFNWTATVSVTSTSQSATMTKIECNQTQTNCSTPAIYQCSSVWIDDSNNVVAKGPLLELENLPAGNYTCNATCSIRETSCSYVAKQITYACNKEQKKTNTIRTILIVISMIVSAAKSIWIIIRCIRWWKIRQRNQI